MCIFLCMCWSKADSDLRLWVYDSSRRTFFVYWIDGWMFQNVSLGFLFVLYNICEHFTKHELFIVASHFTRLFKTISGFFLFNITRWAFHFIYQLIFLIINFCLQIYLSYFLVILLIEKISKLHVLQNNLLIDKIHSIKSTYLKNVLQYISS